MGLEWIGFEPTNPESPSVEEGLPPECVHDISRGRKSHGGSKDFMEAVGQVDRRMKLQNPRNNHPEYSQRCQIASILLLQGTPTRERKTLPSPALGSLPAWREEQREASWAAWACSGTYCLPCKHPIPRCLGSDGTIRLEVISKNKGSARRDPHPP